MIKWWGRIRIEEGDISEEVTEERREGGFKGQYLMWNVWNELVLCMTPLKKLNSVIKWTYLKWDIWFFLYHT